MKTNTFLIGNGIGMALDPNYFTLKQGLDFSWKELGRKDFIKSIIYHSLKAKRKPLNEEDLRNIQEYFFTLREVEFLISGLPPKMKNSFGKIHKIKEPYFSYIYNVARHFFNYDLDKSPNLDKFNVFIENLTKYIHQDKSIINNVFILNYDSLLFKGLHQKGLFNGYDGYLVDGFHDNDGFKRENLDRKHGRMFGWFIHLHGSPLFYTDGEKKIKKDTYNTSGQSAHEPIGDYIKGNEHLILCHPNQKYENIKHSPLLNSYFERFQESIRASSKIILIGYGGQDTHINEVIKSSRCEKEIYIIEWREKGSNRSNFWKKELGVPVKLYSLSSIFDFDFTKLDS